MTLPQSGVPERPELRIANDAPAKWDAVFAKITAEADRDIWQKQGLRLTWQEVELLASVLRSIDGLPFSSPARAGGADDQ